MIDFLQPQIADRSWVNELLAHSDFRACDYNFTNLFLWRGTYGPEIARAGDFLLVHLPGQGGSYLYPAGEGELEEVVALLGEDAAQRGEPLRLVCLTRRQTERLEELYPGRVTCQAERDRFDYLYEIGQLAGLEGKKLHAKRNHIRRFTENNPTWRYEELTPSALEECLEMDREWYRRSLAPGQAPEAERGESTALQNAARYWEELELEGGLLRVFGEVVAFTIGDRLSSDTFDVHFEKAYGELQGAYAMINREFARQVRDRHPEIRFLNREEDMGIEGLRRAKKSYYPAELVEKYTVTLE